MTSDTPPPAQSPAPADFAATVARTVDALLRWGIDEDRALTARMGLDASDFADAAEFADAFGEDSGDDFADDTGVGFTAPVGSHWPAHVAVSDLLAWGLVQGSKLASASNDDLADTTTDSADDSAAQRGSAFDRTLADTLAEFAAWDEATARAIDEWMGLSAPDPILRMHRQPSAMALAAASPRAGDRIHAPSVQIVPIDLPAKITAATGAKSAFLYRENEALFVLADEPFAGDAVDAALAYLDGSRDDMAVELRMAAPQLLLPELDSFVAYRVYHKEQKLMLKWDAPITGIVLAALAGEIVPPPARAISRRQQAAIVDAVQAADVSRFAAALKSPPASQADCWQMKFYLAYWQRHLDEGATLRRHLQGIDWVANYFTDRPGTD